MQVIFDTNVIYTAMRSKRGASAAILAMVGTGRFDLNMSVALALEYEEVLKRESASIPISSMEADELVAFLCANSTRRDRIGNVWPLASDPDDEFIVRLAVSFGCDHLVTYNVRHLQSLAAGGVNVVTPAQFLKVIRGEA